MLNYIWIFLFTIGYVVAMVNGNTELVTKNLFDSATGAVNLCIGLAGAICFWTGLMEIAKKAGILKVISKLAAPAMNFLFPNIPKGHPSRASIVLNLSANFLGIGNAATPFGIRAMQELNTINTNRSVISREMIMFLILNTSMIQLIPGTIMALRSNAGSQNPSHIVPEIWIVSLGTMLFGILLVKICDAIFERRKNV